VTRLFPIQSDPDLEGREPKLVELDEADADEVFDALSSKTSRTLLLELHDEPRPASQLAETVDTTVQNVQYHLTKLEAVDLIEVVDTWYSESGTEMKVYAPVDESLVLFAGEQPKSSLRRLLERLVGVLAALTAAAAIVALAVDENKPSQTGGVNMSGPTSGGGAGSDPVVTALVFLAGGVFVLVALVVLDRV